MKDPSFHPYQNYEKLRALAHRILHGDRLEGEIDPTSLVHDALLKLSKRPSSRDHVPSSTLAARAMRRHLIDIARRRHARKRTAPGQRVSLDSLTATPSKQTESIAIQEALDRLAASYPSQARILELRFFGGLTYPEIAKLEDRPLRSIERDTLFAKTWMARALSEHGD